MSTYITTTFLNLRKAPVKEAGNIVAVMPPDTIVKKIGDADTVGWSLVETVMGNSTIQGFAAQQFLKDTELPLPPIKNTAQIPAVHYPSGTAVITRNGTGRIYPLNEPGLVKKDLSALPTIEEKCTHIHNVVKYLDVEKSLRYAPGAGKTYCNIYAYDVAYCVGAYLPRVWWTAEALADIASGINITPAYDKTVTEYTANRIADWFERYGQGFGWTRCTDTNELQVQVNQGRIGIIVAQRINMNNPGHIDAVVPEVGDLIASRKNGIIVSPLQSQAGSKNKQYFTGLNWWEDASRFKKFSFWYC